MYDLSEMFSNIGYYNRMFKAKTYLDAAYEFYDKYKDIFNEINEHAAIAAESVEEIYIGEGEPHDRNVFHSVSAGKTHFCIMVRHDKPDHRGTAFVFYVKIIRINEKIIARIGC